MQKIVRTENPQLTILRIGKVFNDNEDNTYDLRSVFQELNIYSSFNNVITTGDVVISEQGNLVEKMPIEGNEYIEIEFNTLKDCYDSFHRVFFVYSVDTLVELNDVRSYVIRFTDCIGLINNDTRIGIKYDDNVETIIGKLQDVINKNTDNDVYKNILVSKNVQKECFVFNTSDETSCITSYPFKFVVPLWKPLIFLNYMTNRAVSSEFTSDARYMFCDCLFYQNRNGEFIFTNYKKMFTNPLKTKKTAKFDEEEIVLEKQIGNSKLSTASSNKQGAGAKPEEVRYPVINYKLSRFFDVQSQKLSGILGFTDNVTDFLRVKCEPVVVEKTDIEDILDFYNLDLDVQYSPYAAVNFSPNSVYLYNECDIDFVMKDNHYEKFVLPYERSVAIRQLIQYQEISLELKGSSDLDLGKFIRINLGEAEDNSVVNYINKVKWIISSIHHTYKNDGTYTTNITCFTPYLARKIENSNNSMQIHSKLTTNTNNNTGK